MSEAVLQGVKGLSGEVRVPGDKSISHRALLFSALAKGPSLLKGLLKGEDVLATWRCLEAMGVRIKEITEGVLVQGVGLHGLKAPSQVLDCGNSGTTLRLLMGILAGQPFPSRLTGDASLNRRPMGRVMDPLGQMGARLSEMRAGETERVIRIDPAPLKGVRYELPVASAQVKSALLLAGLYASGTTEVVEPIPSRNHTELMLGARGASLQREGQVIRIQSGGELRSQDMEVPGDISSAAFFLVGGAIVEEGEVRLPDVGVNPTRTGLLEVLEAMGARLEVSQMRQWGGEAVAQITVRPSRLRGCRVSGGLIPRMIDEIPVLCVAAALAQGRTEIRDAAELRVKESDRIQAVVEEFGNLSIKIKGLEDGMEIDGPQDFPGGRGHSRGDHRMAMALAIAALRAKKAVHIEQAEAVAVSYPEFWEHYGRLGGQFKLS